MTDVGAGTPPGVTLPEPTQSGRAELPSGVNLYYERHGSGVPLVLIAGTGCDHLFWARQVLHYAGQHEVILLDHRGAGQSDAPSDVESYTPAVMADDVDALLNVLGVESAHVAGHSLGSCISQELALRHPSRVLSLQLHATWGRADVWLRRAFIGTTRYPLEHGDLQATFKAVTMWMLSPIYLDTWEPPRVAEMVTTAFIKNPNLRADEGMLGHLRADEVHDTLERLADIRVPTLVTAGEADVLIPPRYGEKVAERVPGAEFHLFRGKRSSHAYPWEMEEEFNRVTADFLEGVG
jgi:pimeloyl-ACP methyl ester carboxylesterase